LVFFVISCNRDLFPIFYHRLITVEPLNRERACLSCPVYTASRFKQGLDKLIGIEISKVFNRLSHPD